MIEHYFLQYGFVVTLILFFLGSIFIYRTAFKVPAIVIGASSFLMLAPKILHAITASSEYVSYLHDQQGRVLSADIEFTIWQSVSVWVDLIGLIAIACGFLVMCWQLKSFLKNNP